MVGFESFPGIIKIESKLHQYFQISSSGGES
jgi:hypothetical protein